MTNWLFNQFLESHIDGDNTYTVFSPFLHKSKILCRSVNSQCIRTTFTCNNLNGKNIEKNLVAFFIKTLH